MKKIILLWLCLTSLVFAQELKPLEEALTGFEKAIEGKITSSESLQTLKDNVTPLLDKASDAIRALEPQLEAAKTRLEQLTPVQEKDKPAPVENDEAKKIRETQAAEVAKIDTQLKQFRLALVRGEQILQKITDKRRALFTAQLFEKQTSPLEPLFWQELRDAVPLSFRASLQFLRDNAQYIYENRNFIGFSVLFLLCFGLIKGWKFLRHLLKNHTYHRFTKQTDLQTPIVLSSFVLFLENFIPPLLFTLIFSWGVEVTGVFPYRTRVIFAALPYAVGIYVLTNALSLATLAPFNETKRYFALSDANSVTLHRLLKRIALCLGGGMLALALVRVLFLPVSITVFTTLLTAVLVAIVTIRPLLRNELQEFSLKPLLWLFALVLFCAELFGLGAFAIYLATRALILTLILFAARLLYAFYEGVFADFFEKTRPRAQIIAQSFGIRVETLELFGAIIGGLLKCVLILAGFMLLLGPWGIQTTDYSARLDDALFGLRLGDLRHSLSLIFGALLLLGVGIYLTKRVQGWFATSIFPRTRFDKGLQDSLVTIFGYCGFVLVFIGALTVLGVNLGSVAILAGALSVGIGFGLQSIVSNFVSGLILLAERPIRIGDSIVVKGEEGYVKKISVRSTEIETFERATVILPNSELISGVVKNWTHSNRFTRTVIHVRVAYDSDVDVVEASLLEAANVKNVLKDPPPKVYLSKLADNGLEFELRAVISNVDKLLSTRSSIHMNILRIFREAGIIISPPEQRVQTPAKKAD